MLRLRPLSSISLFGRVCGHFPVPAGHGSCVARSGGPERRIALARMRLALEGREHGGSLGSALGKRIACALVAAAMLVGGNPAGASTAAELRATTAEMAPSLDREIEAAIVEAAQRFNLPMVWIRAVMRVESRMDPQAISPKGAMGLMQLMPPTWQDYQRVLRLGDDPFAVRDNILAGTAFLRDLRDRYGPAGMLAAYNAGPGRYEQSLSAGRPLPAETRSYIALVSAQLEQADVTHTSRSGKETGTPWTDAMLFVGRPRALPEQLDLARPPAIEAPGDTVFVRRGRGGGQ